MRNEGFSVGDVSPECWSSPWMWGLGAWSVRNPSFVSVDCTLFMSYSLGKLNFRTKCRSTRPFWLALFDSCLHSTIIIWSSVFTEISFGSNMFTFTSAVKPLESNLYERGSALSQEFLRGSDHGPLNPFVDTSESRFIFDGSAKTWRKEQNKREEKKVQTRERIFFFSFFFFFAAEIFHLKSSIIPPRKWFTQDVLSHTLTTLTVMLEWCFEYIATVRQVGHFSGHYWVNFSFRFFVKIQSKVPLSNATHRAMWTQNRKFRKGRNFHFFSFTYFFFFLFFLRVKLKREYFLELFTTTGNLRLWNFPSHANAFRWKGELFLRLLTSHFLLY